MRRRLRDEFDVTLPRFDLMAQLDKAPNGMTLGELSQRMMVSNGNVTGLAERLVEQGLLDRRAVAERPPRADRQPHRRGPPRVPRHGAHARGLDRARFSPASMPARSSTLMTLLAKTKASARKAMTRAGGDMIAQPRHAAARRTTRRNMCASTVDGKVATLTLNRPDKKNPLTFESYAEIANIFRAAAKDKQVKAFVITGEGGNFCSGGDVFEIIGPLVEMDTVEPARIHPHDRRGREGDARSARSRSSRRSTACAPAPARSSRWPPTCGSEPRRPRSRSCSTASGLPAATWAPARSCRASSGRAAPRELLYTGRVMGGEEAERWGFFNRLAAPESVLADATKLAKELADGPTFANAHDQAHARDGMGDVGRAGDRGRSRRAGAVHGDGRLRARLPGVRGETEAGIRGQLMSLAETLTWPFFEEHHRRFADGACALGRRDPARPAA